MLDSDKTRMILFHKHPVSARMHFLHFQYDDRRTGVCAFKPLPKLASLVENASPDVIDRVTFHPALVQSWAEKQFSNNDVSLQIEPEFCEYVEIPNAEIVVYLAGVKGYELPHTIMREYGAKFISLMECVGVAPVEMLLLRRAYGVIMGGQS